MTRRRAGGPSESTLTKRMRLRIVKRGGWARKTHGGPQGAGWPDLVCIYRGYPVMLEVKLPGREKTLTTLQRVTLEKMREAGALAFCVTTIAQVDLILDAIDRVKGE